MKGEASRQMGLDSLYCSAINLKSLGICVISLPPSTVPDFEQYNSLYFIDVPVGALMFDLALVGRNTFRSDGGQRERIQTVGDPVPVYYRYTKQYELLSRKEP